MEADQVWFFSKYYHEQIIVAALGEKRVMREAVTAAKQRPGFPLRSLRSFQDGDENRGQLFALLSQRRELFGANNPRFQFKPVGRAFKAEIKPGRALIYPT